MGLHLLLNHRQASESGSSSGPAPCSLRKVVLPRSTEPSAPCLALGSSYHSAPLAASRGISSKVVAASAPRFCQAQAPFSLPGSCNPPRVLKANTDKGPRMNNTAGI